MRVLVGTGVFSASIGRRRRARFEPQVGLMAGNQLFLAAACRQVGYALHEPVHANDLWIAASAVHLGARLATADAVFDDIPGLSLHR